jgi:hypothetical protein
MKENISKVFLLFALFLGCCQNQQNPSELIQPTRIIVDNQASDFTLSEVVDTIQFIVLETNKDNLLALAHKIVMTDSAIYFMDKRMTKNIVAFDHTGKFISTIGNLGKGPGEYVDPESFCITHDNKIAVTDFASKKIIFYDQKGNLIQEKQTDFYPIGIESYDSSLYITSNSPYDLIYKVNIDGQEHSIDFFDDPQFRGFETYLRMCQDGLYFMQVFDDTIYFLGEETIHSKVFLDYRGRNMSRSEYLNYPPNEFSGMKLRNIIPPGKRFNKYNYFDNGDLITYVFSESTQSDDRLLFVLHNKSSGKTIFTDFDTGFDDLFNMMNLSGIAGNWKEFFIMSIDSYLFLEKYKIIKEFFGSKRPEYLSIIEKVQKSVSPVSNPILVLLSFKKDF